MHYSNSVLLHCNSLSVYTPFSTTGCPQKAFYLLTNIQYKDIIFNHVIYLYMSIKSENVNREITFNFA